MAEKLIAKFGKKFKTEDGEDIVLYADPEGTPRVGYVTEEPEYFGYYDAVQNANFTAAEFAQRLLELAPKCAPQKPEDLAEALCKAVDQYFKDLDDCNDMESAAQAMKKAVKAVRKARRG